MRKLSLALLVGFAVAASGCFDINETLTLERNLSGQAGFSMKVNMEPLVGFMAQMQKSMSGKTGAPTAEELAAAKADLLKSEKPDSDFEKQKEDMSRHLPPGVKLLNADFKQDGLQMTMSLQFAFDNLAALNKIKFDDSSSGAAGGGGGMAPGNPVSSPFDLQVTDQGGILLITSSVINPVEDAKQQTSQMPMDSDMQKQFAALFNGLHVGVKITAPFDVLEQNATSKQGHTLAWDYDLASLQKMTADQMKQGVRVKYKK